MVIEGLAKEAWDERFFKVGRLWNGPIPDDAKDYIEYRIEMLDEIAKVVLGNRVRLLPEATAQDISGQWHTWKPLPKAPEYLLAPAFYYRILPNEIFIDIDTDPNDRETLKKVAKELFILLDGLRIPFLAGWTGHRSVHIHIYFALPGKTPVETVQSPEAYEFQQAFFGWLVSKLPEDLRPYVDAGVMTASRHVARAFYSLNMKSGTWKLPFNEYSEVKVWEVPVRLYEAITENIKRKQELEALLNALDDEDSKPAPAPRVSGRGKYAWIEAVASAGLPDGRKRFIFHALMPYLAVVKGLEEDEAVEVAQKFIEASAVRGASGKIAESWLRSVYRSAKRWSFHPFRLETFLQRVGQSIGEYIRSEVLKNAR